MLDTNTNPGTFRGINSYSKATTASGEESRQVRTILPPRQLAAKAYEGSIEDAQVLAFDWRRSTDNPDGLCLRLAVLVHDDQGAAHVFDCIDADNEDRLYAVFGAVGMPAPTDPLAEAHTLANQRVRITVKNIVPKLGRHAGMAKAVVSSWIPCR